MSPDSIYEDWILEIGGEVVEKKAEGQPLSKVDRIIYCVWITYICMTNAGDLSQAHILNVDWKRDAISISSELMLPISLESFSLSNTVFEREYYDRIDRICEEIRATVAKAENLVEQAAPSNR